MQIVKSVSWTQMTRCVRVAKDRVEINCRIEGATGSNPFVDGAADGLLFGIGCAHGRDRGAVYTDSSSLSLVDDLLIGVNDRLCLDVAVNDVVDPLKHDEPFDLVPGQNVALEAKETGVLMLVGDRQVVAPHAEVQY